jgi:hypothetical protein
MSQKDALQLAKDVYEFDLKTTYGGYARWVAPAERVERASLTEYFSIFWLTSCFISKFGTIEVLSH